MNNKTRNLLKARLKLTEQWVESYIEVEKNRQISKKALRKLNRDNPILGLIFIIIYLPTKIYDFFYSVIWWNKYRKACNEINIIKEELNDK